MLAIKHDGMVIKQPKETAYKIWFIKTFGKPSNQFRSINHCWPDVDFAHVTQPLIEQVHKPEL